MTKPQQQAPPWYVPYLFLAALLAAAFCFALQERMSAAEFLAFAAALGFRVPPSEQRDEGKVENVDISAETATLTEEPSSAKTDDEVYVEQPAVQRYS